MSTLDAHLCQCGHRRANHDGYGCLACRCAAFKRQMVVRQENAVTTGGHRVKFGARPIR